VEKTLFDVRVQKQAVEAWVQKQVELPSRKETRQKFPKVPQRIIRTVLQSLRDKGSNGAAPD